MVDPNQRRLSPQNIFVIGCQLIAVWLLLEGLIGLPYMVGTILDPESHSDRWDQYVTIIMSILNIILPLLLFIASNWLAEHFVSDKNAVAIDPKKGLAKSTLMVAILILGFWGLMNSLPKMVYGYFRETGKFYSRALLTSTIKAGFSLFLIIVSVPLSRFFTAWSNSDSSSTVKSSSWMAVLIVLIVFLFILMVNSLS